MNPKRVALLRVAKARVGMCDDDYRQLLQDHGGARSAKCLSDPGFDAVMTRFRQLGFTSNARQRGFGDRIGMASPGQLELIRKLWSGLAKDTSDAGLHRWLERFGVSALRFLDDRTAPKVIAGLRAWEARRASQSTDGGSDG